jgi:hypothetical protein
LARTNWEKRKRDFKRMVEKTKRNATRTGMKWEDDEVDRVMRGIERDESTYEMAMAIGRSYYAMQTARSHIRFAMDHAAVLYADLGNVRHINRKKA